MITDRIAATVDAYNAQRGPAVLVEVERMAVIRAACGHPVLHIYCSTCAGDLLALALPLRRADIEELHELATNDDFIAATGIEQWTPLLAADCVAWLVSAPSLQ